MPGSDVRFFSVNDLARMLFGVLITAAGGISTLLFLARLKRKDFSLLYFGIASALYGVRLFISGSSYYMHRRWDLADPIISLVIIIPFFLFFVETVSPQWKRISWMIVGVFAGIALFGIYSIFIRHNLLLAKVISNTTALVALPVFTVMLFVPLRSGGRDRNILRTGLLIFIGFAIYTNLAGARIIQGSSAIEFIGFIFFLGCLGYVAMNRTQRNEERLLALNKEMEIARGIQAGLLPEKNFSVKG